jgi:hypothetical protein
MDLGLAFSYPFQDKDWVTKLLLAGVLLLIPVLGIIVVMGWSLAITRNVIKGEAQPLVGLSDFADLLTIGFKAFMITLIYALPIIIVSIPFGFIASMFDSPDTEGWIAFASICFSCFSILYGLVLAFIYPAALGELAANDDIGAALNPSRIIELVRKAPNAYVLTFLATMGVGFLAGFGFLLCFVGIIFTSAYAYAVYGHLYGQAYLAATAQ